MKLEQKTTDRNFKILKSSWLLHLKSVSCVKGRWGCMGVRLFVNLSNKFISSVCIVVGSFNSGSYLVKLFCLEKLVNQPIWSSLILSCDWWGWKEYDKNVKWYEKPDKIWQSCQTHKKSVENRNVLHHFERTLWVMKSSLCLVEGPYNSAKSLSLKFFVTSSTLPLTYHKLWKVSFERILKSFEKHMYIWGIWTKIRNSEKLVDKLAIKKSLKTQYFPKTQRF